MPHHSKHNQHQRKVLDSAITSSPTGGYRNQQQSFQNSPSSDNEPCKHDQAPAKWMTQSVDHMENHKRGYYQSQYHRVPSSPPDATDGSLNGTHNHESYEGIGNHNQNKRDPSQEIASVLLMAAAAATSVKEISTLENRSDVGSQDIEVVSTHGSRPLKKRKSDEHIMDIAAGEVGAHSDDAYHVSPISHSSKSGTTVESNNRSHDTPSTSSAHSFDMKEDSHSNTNGTSMKEGHSHSRAQHSMYQMITQFPSLLHWILSEPSSQTSANKFAVDFSVLQWVSHGQAWRIIRWDAFHREVIPALFPQLVSNATDAGSIDAFMWQLKAWGFQEIKDGPDIGAFAHSLFRRGHPKMCEEMKFEPVDGTISSSLAIDTRSILRVPSLNSSTSASTTRPNNLSDHSVGIIDYTGSPLHQTTTTAHPANKYLAGHHARPPAYVNYRPEEMNLTPEGWQFSSKYNTQGNWPSTNGMMPSRKVIDIGKQTLSPYSPIRIRSSRGAARRHSLSNSVTTSPSAIASQLDNSSTATSTVRGFPVSNRGMGRRTIVAASSIGTKQLSPVSTNDEVVMLSNLKSTTASTSLDSQEKNIEAKFPRSVLKRKLPLMATVPMDEVTETST